MWLNNAWKLTPRLMQQIKKVQNQQRIPFTIKKQGVVTKA